MNGKIYTECFKFSRLNTRLAYTFESLFLENTHTYSNFCFKCAVIYFQKRDVNEKFE